MFKINCFSLLFLIFQYLIFEIPLLRENIFYNQITKLHETVKNSKSVKVKQTIRNIFCFHTIFLMLELRQHAKKQPKEL